VILGSCGMTGGDRNLNSVPVTPRMATREFVA
jgi:hypothetical protein